MTKINYTVTIGEVLMSWLDENGWDVYYCSSAIDHDGGYYCDIDARELGRKVIRFTQSELDDNCLDYADGTILFSQLHRYIRDGLERQARDE